MSSQVSENKKVAKGFMWNTIGQVADASNAIYLYMARYLFGGEVFGLFAIAFSLIELFNRFLIGGYGDASTYFVAKYLNDKTLDENQKQEKVYSALAHTLVIPLIYSIGLAILTQYGTAWVYEKFWSNHDPILKEVLFILSWILPLNVLVKIPLEAVKAHLDMRWAVYITGGLLPLGTFGFTIGFYFLDIGIWSLVYGQLLAMGLSIFGSLYAFSRYFSIIEVIKRIPQSFTLKEVHLFAVPQSLNMLMNFGLVRMDTLMLSAFLGANEIGIYTLLSEWTRSMRSAKTSFSKVFSPLVAKYQGLKDSAGMQNALHMVSFWTSQLSTPFFYFIIFFYSDIILGIKEPWIYDPALVFLLCVGPLLSCYWGLAGNLLLMTGHSFTLMLNSALLFGINFVLNYTLIPTYGLMGAALATAISSILISSIQMLEMNHFEKIRFNYLNSFKIIVPSLVFAIPAYVIYSKHNFIPFEEWNSLQYLSVKGGLFILCLFLFLIIQSIMPGKDSLRSKLKSYKKNGFG